ncbi:MAG: hypothetical protein H0X04_04900 [Chthoniobacterales bacterium]|nr:hypothetical protein [Chthoniobacterales bacterium]
MPIAVLIMVVGVGVFLISVFLIVKKEIAYRAGTLANEPDGPVISVGGSVGDRTIIGHDNVVD